MHADELARRTGARRSGDHWIVRCPAHDDHRPSLDFRDGDMGVLVYCRSRGCHLEAICRAWGLRPAELFFDQQSREAWVARWSQPKAPVPKWWKDPKLAGLAYGVADTVHVLEGLAETAGIHASAAGESVEGWDWAEMSARLAIEAERLTHCIDWQAATNRPAGEDA